MAKLHDAMKKKWRPMFAWVFIVWFALLGLTLIVLLWLEKTTLNEAGAVIMAMIAAGGGITGTYAYKRTTEKLEGLADEVPPPDFQEGN